ncbi:hypothetical protein H7H82_00165 [Mycobacterium heidelbergense]|uniref:hypothetical protein n=1 Tax=Mycobacterium heidelbergense TaxID=53376 RepID=UPI00114F781B|nr:hypothetical protein [Mycobacterium heidelbergense]MCV7049035.1 hypothetical protein [Mycobacterium heidelbergense]BBZ50369.1 hypothetical protein MHEI_20860 [Mycobacterium heidelbergense]
MDLAAHPHITAGVALASAAVIAAGPMAQHLPDLHLAQQLRQVSVSDIQLTDASSALDLFSGVENELASLAGGAAAATLPAATVGAFANPITTWANVFQTAANNLGVLGRDWLLNPFPVASQVVLNELGFGNTFAIAINTAGSAFWSTLVSNGKTGLVRTMFTAGTDLAGGNLSGAIAAWTNLENAIFTGAGEDFLSALAAPGNITANLNKLVTELFSVTGLSNSVVLPISYFGYVVPTALGDTAQGVINAVQAGDPVGVLSALVNAPANITGDLVNGFTSIAGAPWNGLIGGPVNPGFAWNLGVELPQLLSQSIGAKAGQNTSSLIPGAFTTFGQLAQKELTQLWNTATKDLGTIFNKTFPSLNGLATALQGVPAALAPLGSLIGNLTGQVGSVLGNIGAQIGTLLFNLLKLL